MIVARHEVPGKRCREPRPVGTVEVWWIRPTIQPLLASNLSRNRFNRPAGRNNFPHDSRHFVPGYDHPVPPGQNTLSPRGFD